MKGDYYRYLAKFKSGIEKKEVADLSMKVYEENGYQAPRSGRQQRNAASRAMERWHVQRLFGYGEVGQEHEQFTQARKKSQKHWFA